VYEIIVYIMYNYYRFWPVMRPTSAMSDKMEEYIVIIQTL